MNLNNKPAKDEQVKQLIRPLADFLSDTEITELTINRPKEIWVKTKQGWASHIIEALTLDYLHSLAIAIIVFNGLSVKSINSVILPEGQRGQIVLPPACIEGTLSMSIRKHSMVVKTLEELEAEGTLDNVFDVSFNKPTRQEAEKLLTSQDFTRLDDFEVELLELKRQGAIKQFLERAVLLKRNIIIAGKTGSGKTTFARSLIKKVPSHERLITIEDVHELFLENHPNRFHMLYGDGEGRITADDALKSCMRQSPDRIFLAELRGSETWEYLSSLNTGHPGSITTTHANNCLQTFERLTTLIKKSKVGSQLNMETIKLTLYNTVDIVLFLKDFKVIEVFYDPIFAKLKI